MTGFLDYQRATLEWKCDRLDAEQLARRAMPPSTLSLLGLTLSAVYPLSISRMFELHGDTAALGRAAAIASGVGVTFGPLLLGTFSDIVGLGWATTVLPVFAIAGLLIALKPI